MGTRTEPVDVIHRGWLVAVIVLIMAQLFRTTGIVAVIAGYAGVPLLGMPVPQDFIGLLPPFFDYVLSLGVIPVAIQYGHGRRSGWALAVAFAIIGLVDAVLGETLVVGGYMLFLIPASAWVLVNVVLLVILFGPERGRGLIAPLAKGEQVGPEGAEGRVAH